MSALRPFISKQIQRPQYTQVSRNYRRDEAQVLAELLPIAELEVGAKTQAWSRARDLVIGIRQSPLGKGGVDALLNEFALSSEEGIVLMCLAEALLRIPDKVTTDRLIRDKLGSGDWLSHLGNSESMFVNASAWGLLLTGKVINYKNDDEQSNVLKRTINRLGEPVIRSSVRIAMQIMGAQFVMGTNIAAAINRAQKQEANGYCYSYDMLGEGARTMADADNYMNSYLNAIEHIGKAAKGRGPIQSPGISIKLSALHPRYEVAQKERVLAELVPRLSELAMAASSQDISLTVDAEEADRLELSLDIIKVVFADKRLGDWQGFGIAIQAYQKRALDLVDWVNALSQEVGKKMMIRLVKGAYWDSEIKWSQEGGLEDYPVFTQKAATDVCYQACVRRLLSYRENIYPQFATHNAYTVAMVLAIDEADPETARQGYEFQRLHGMGEALFTQVMIEEKVACRIYAPVGEHVNLLAYLVRRLLENGANSSFVNNIVDENVPIESLIDDPVETVKQWRNKRNTKIPLPKDLFRVDNKSARHNSCGDELSDSITLAKAQQDMSDWWSAYLPSKGDIALFNPGNLSEQIGAITYLNRRQIQEALSKADEGFASWSNTTVTERAKLLRSLADNMEIERYHFAALCIKEAGKTLSDALSEIREAIDFCRYYADQAARIMADDSLRPLGVVLCISPWNFPLAIFLGQIAAALVTGNTVLAKPAEQTSLVALKLKTLMLELGFPDEVMTLLISPGKPVGDALLKDERIKAVMFTGSTATAKHISRELAQRPDTNTPFVAETGGQNVMIVDSTALPEQVVDDVINSGFQSAGQRCSALRVLYLQEEIADNVIEMIRGAMQELSVGDSAFLKNDIGPVIDEPALSRLQEHKEKLCAKGSKAKLLFETNMPEDLNGFYFPPSLYELESLDLLEGEVFGPVVHIIRYKAKNLNLVIDEINETGYGLTLGVHSRIQTISNAIAASVKVGNVYINRNIIGAVVGVQPFGGCGLSGTGPKAGGPSYLKRLLIQEPIQEPIQDDSLPTELLPQKSLLDSKNAEFKIDEVLLQSQKTWGLSETYLRVSIIRRLLAILSKDESLLSKVGLQNLVVKCEGLFAELNELKPMALPGPTGESNILNHDAKGILVHIWDEGMDIELALLQIISALLTGNSLILLSDTLLRDSFLRDNEQKPVTSILVDYLHRAGLPKNLICEIPISKAAFLDRNLRGIILSQASVYYKFVQQLVASSDGAILPFITKGNLQHYMDEKTVSIDTTAAGGNASLMTM